MESHSNIYCQDVTQQPEQNRQALLLALLSKLALLLLLGVIYAGIRFLS